MKFVAALALAATFAASGCGSFRWSTAIALEAVTSLGQDRLIAVGSSEDISAGAPTSGVVARSDDGGRNWTVAYPDLAALTYVAAAGDRIIVSRYCLASTAGGQDVGRTPSTCLFASDDGGHTWRDLGAGRLVDPTFVDASYGWAHDQIPAGTELDETLDGGNSWTALDSGCPPDKPRIYRAVVTGRQEGYLICFAEPTDAGQPWALVRRTASGQGNVLLEGDSSWGTSTKGLADEYVRGFTIRPDGLGLLWTDGLYSTSDGGQAWTPVAVPVTIDDYSGGIFQGGGAVVGADHAYLVRRGSKSSVVEYLAGTFTTLVEWPYPL